MPDQVGKTRHTFEVRKWVRGGGLDGGAVTKTKDNTELVATPYGDVQYIKDENQNAGQGQIQKAEVRIETREPYYELTADMVIFHDGRLMSIFEILPHDTLPRWIIIRARREYSG